MDKIFHVQQFIPGVISTGIQQLVKDVHQGLFGRILQPRRSTTDFSFPFTKYLTDLFGENLDYPEISRTSLLAICLLFLEVRMDANGLVIFGIRASNNKPRRFITLSPGPLLV